MTEHYDVVVVGGGPAGSVAARCIAQTGLSVAILEKHLFPRETLCGEFLSREVLESIRAMGLETEFHALHPNPLTTFTLLFSGGGSVRVPLGFAAYGVRRGKFDAMLLDAAAKGGAHVLQPAEVIAVERNRDGFAVRFIREGRCDTVRCRCVVGAYGRTSNLDRFLGRPFSFTRTGFTAVKFHVPAQLLENIHPKEIIIALGPGIYCGVSHVGDGTATICFLEQRSHGASHPRVRVRELAALNRDFGRVVTPRALQFILRAPVYGTGNLFFGTRETVEKGILMAGDSAGVIAPLAGDGIGIAMEQARLLGDLFSRWNSFEEGKDSLAETYRRDSSRLFARRRRVALLCQELAFARTLNPVIASLVTAAPGLLRAAIRGTRGVKSVR